MATENILVRFSHGLSELEDTIKTLSLTLTVRGQAEVQRAGWTFPRPRNQLMAELGGVGCGNKSSFPSLDSFSHLTLVQ